MLLILWINCSKLKHLIKNWLCLIASFLSTNNFLIHFSLNLIYTWHWLYSLNNGKNSLLLLVFTLAVRDWTYRFLFCLFVFNCLRIARNTVKSSFTFECLINCLKIFFYNLIILTLVVYTLQPFIVFILENIPNWALKCLFN